jgi:Domain of unknown function (DUF4424)
MFRVLAFAPIALAASALANDTTATTAAGGLELQRTDAIDLVSEDLFVSVDQIRVRYVFRNRTAKDVQAIVAFPMPERDLSQEYGSDVAFPSNFATKISGRPVRTTLERKVMAKGKDHKALLDQLGIPVAPEAIGRATAAMDRLPAARKVDLIGLGLAGEEEYDDDGKGMKKHLIPLWTVKDIWHWTQRFPAGRPINVEHRYVPGAGGSVESAIAYPQFRHTADSKWTINRYCIDTAFLRSVDRLAGKDEMHGPNMPDRRIDYILTTGANWRSPIGDFRLVVDKGKPGNLVSFCEAGVRQISPTLFEVRHKNWRPTRDLYVLIIEPRR